MNTLSWFLYLASVLPKFGDMLGIIGTLVLIAGVIFIVPGHLFPWNFSASYTPKEEVARSRDKFAYLSTRMVIMGLVFLALSNLIPSTRTFYMIAASEMGEVVVKSDEAKELMNELKDTITYQLRSMRVETDKTQTSR